MVSIPVSGASVLSGQVLSSMADVYPVVWMGNG